MSRPDHLRVDRGSQKQNTNTQTNSEDALFSHGFFLSLNEVREPDCVNPVEHADFSGMPDQSQPGQASGLRPNLGGHGILTLVRAVTRGTGYGGVDGRCGGDPQAARPEAENRPPGCPTFAEVAAGKSLSSNLGTESGESGSAATALAPASAGADADTDHESAAGRGEEGRQAREEQTVQRTGTSADIETLLGSRGQSATERIIGAAGPVGSQGCGV